MDVAWNWLEMTAMNSLEASILRESKSRTTTQGIPWEIKFHKLRPTDIFNKDRCSPLNFHKGDAPQISPYSRELKPKLRVLDVWAQRLNFHSNSSILFKKAHIH
jgi:hypothetical protein